jgi:peptidoglycan/LPS O-acetylase OafA/YrhL
MKSLVIASLVIALVIFAITLPLFIIVRGTEVEIPFALMVVTLGITGVLSAQLAFIKKGKEEGSRVLSVAALVQILLLIILIIFVFINVDKAYYWYPAIALVLAITLVVIVSTKIGLDKRLKNGSLI